MKTVKLGQQGLKVPAVGLGCMGMSEFYGQSDDTENLKILDEALEIGCNFWDTSDMYGPFTNERLLGKALEYRREKVILATKFGVKRGQDGSWLGTSGSPEYVKACCDLAERANTRYRSLLQHRTDPMSPLKKPSGDGHWSRQAKSLHRPIRSHSIEPEKAHHTHPISACKEHSLWSRDVEQAFCQKRANLELALSPTSTGRGFLTGAITQRSDLDPDDWRLSTPRFSEEAMANNQKLVEKVKEIAVKKGSTPSQVALAWVLAQGDDIAAIPGTRHSKYLKLNWASQEIVLSKMEKVELDAFSQNFNVVGDRY